MTASLPKARRPRAAKAVPPTPPLPPDAAAQLSDNDMYDRMVSAILDHKLPPGTKLVEDKLAAAFGVSRTRVRPVLVRLANEQVVTLTPNRGASIAQPTPQEALEAEMVRLTPMGRLGRVEDIAACALYLASPAASYVTGEIYGVNGGLVALNMTLPRAFG